MYLVSTSSTLSGASAGIGVIIGPRTWGMKGIKEGRRFAADNDAFHGKFTEESFLAHLARLLPYRENCLFVAAPDVVRDSSETAKLFTQWGPRIRALGFPVAWVAQNGAEPADIPDCDAVFIGGTTAWKLSSQALEICLTAKRRGLWVHIGRVNSAQRCLSATRMLADSVDGTHMAFKGHTQGLSDIESWVRTASNAPLQTRLM